MKQPKIPKSIGACADLLYTTRQSRLRLEKEAAEAKAFEQAIKDYIVDTLPVSDTGAQGKVARVQVVPKEIPTAADWAKIYAYIKKNSAWELMQRRLSDAAVRERWEAGVKIPGVDKFNAKEVSCTKL